jgi:hypothetical protein
MYRSTRLCAELGCGWQRFAQYPYANKALVLTCHLKYFQHLLPAEALCSW